MKGRFRFPIVAGSFSLGLGLFMVGVALQLVSLPGADIGAVIWWHAVWLLAAGGTLLFHSFAVLRQEIFRSG